MRTSIFLTVICLFAPIAAEHTGTPTNANLPANATGAGAPAVVNTATCRVCGCGTYSEGVEALSAVVATTKCQPHTTQCTSSQKYAYNSLTVTQATATCINCPEGQATDPANACACKATPSPTPAPTKAPTAATGTPTPSPTKAPTTATDAPTPAPTAAPTKAPTAATDAPSPSPTKAPTAATDAPSPSPTKAPTPAPTIAYCVAGTEPYWHPEKKQEVKASMTVVITKAAYDANKATYDAAFKATIVAEVCGGTMCTTADVIIAVSGASRRRRLTAGDPKIKVDYEIKGLEPTEVQTVFAAVKAITASTAGSSTPFTSKLTTEFNALATAAGIATISEPSIASVAPPEIAEEVVATVSTPAPTPDGGVNAGTSASLSAFVAFIPILYALSSTSVQ